MLGRMPMKDIGLYHFIQKGKWNKSVKKYFGKKCNL